MTPLSIVLIVFAVLTVAGLARTLLSPRESPPGARAQWPASPGRGTRARALRRYGGGRR